jgi:hypothetical protein
MSDPETFLADLVPDLEVPHMMKAGPEGRRYFKLFYAPEPGAEPDLAITLRTTEEGQLLVFSNEGLPEPERAAEHLGKEAWFSAGPAEAFVDKRGRLGIMVALEADEITEADVTEALETVVDAAREARRVCPPAS